MIKIVFTALLIATAPNGETIEIEENSYDTAEECLLQAEADAKNLALSNLFVSVEPMCVSTGIITKENK